MGITEFAAKTIAPPGPCDKIYLTNPLVYFMISGY